MLYFCFILIAQTALAVVSAAHNGIWYLGIVLRLLVYRLY